MLFDAQDRPVLDHAACRRFSTIHEALAHSRAHDVPVGVCARVVGVQEVKGALGGHRIQLVDLAGRQQFDTLPVRDNERLMSAAWRYLEEGQRVILYGQARYYDKGHERYDGSSWRLEALDLRMLTSNSSLLCQGPSLEQECDALARDLIRQGIVGRWMINEAREILGVDAQYISPRFEVAEIATMLQGLAWGQVGRELNSRVSIFLFSGPGTGKTLLGGYAQLFAPIYHAVQPGNVTPAGIGASVYMTSGGWRARPGLLSDSSQGICHFDDMHRIEKKHRGVVQTVLMPVMEEGVIKMAKVASGRYEARCGLFMTANRLSIHEGKYEQVQSVEGRARDLILPFDVLSRVDVVICLGVGDDALRSAMKMAAARAVPEYSEEEDENRATPSEPSELERRKARLRGVVARVKDLIPVVDTGPVEAKIKRVTLETGVILRGYTANLSGVDEDSYDGDALARREANTMRKLVGAFARSEGRSTATEDDVERAWAVVGPKLEVVRYIGGSRDKIEEITTRAAALKEVQDASEERFVRLVALHSGEEVRLEKAAEVMRCTEKTARRDLARQRVQPREGWYAVPTLREHHEAGVPDPTDLSAELEATPQEAGLGELPAALRPRVVEPEPEPAPVFEDCLPVPPEEVLPIVEAGAKMEAVEKSNVSLHLFELALRESEAEAYCYTKAIAKGLTEAAVQHAGMPTVEATGMMARLHEWLLSQTWEERGLRALGLYASAGLGDQLWLLDDQMRERQPWEKPIPPEVMEGIEAVRHRLLTLRALQAAKEREELERRKAAAGPPRQEAAKAPLTWAQMGWV